MSSPEDPSFLVEWRGFDYPELRPGASRLAPSVTIFGIDPVVETYIGSHGLRFIAPIDEQGQLDLEQMCLVPKPDSGTPAAQTLRTLMEKETKGLIPSGTYAYAANKIITDAQTRYRQTGE